MRFPISGCSRPAEKVLVRADLGRMVNSQGARRMLPVETRDRVEGLPSSRRAPRVDRQDVETPKYAFDRLHAVDGPRPAKTSRSSTG